MDAAPAAPAAPERVLVIAVDDSDDSQKAFSFAVDNIYREGDQVSGGWCVEGGVGGQTFGACQRSGAEQPGG
jgi:hypothetical protein